MMNGKGVVGGWEVPQCTRCDVRLRPPAAPLCAEHTVQALHAILLLKQGGMEPGIWPFLPGDGGEERRGEEKGRWWTRENEGEGCKRMDAIVD